MSQKSKDCILCSVPYINMGDHIGSDDVVTICQGCRAELHAFVQDTQTKIASYPQSESDVQACIAEIESNMTFLATRNDFVYWQFQRAHLVGEIGQLLLDGKITPSGFRNLVKALPSESNHRSSRWSLEGTELVKNSTIRGYAVNIYRYDTSGGEPRSLSHKIVPLVGPFSGLDNLSTQSPRPKSSGCLVIFLAILTSVGFWLVCMLT